MTPQGLLTVKELSSYLGVSPTTVYRFVENRAIPFIKRPGLGLKFRPKEVDEWLETSTKKPLPFSYNHINNQQFSLTDDPAKVIFIGDGKHTKGGGNGEMAKAKSKSRQNLGYGAIYSRKSTKWGVRWYIDYRDSRGNRVQKVAKNARSQQEAEEALQQAVHKERLQALGMPSTKNRVKFEEFAEIYYRDYLLSAWKRGDLEKSRLDRLTEFFKGLDLIEVTPMMIERFRAQRLKEGNTRSTTNRYLALLKRMYTLAMNDGYVLENPVKKVRFFSEADNVKERILTYEEEYRLMAVAPPYLKSILVVALNTGMRFSEIMNLQWDHVDFLSGRIRIERTKSGKIRFVNINAPLLQELQQLKAKASGSPFLFTNPKTGQPFTLVRKSFLTACKKAEIQNLRFHDLRHTFATRLVRKGVDIETIRVLLGHYSISLTQRYAHSNHEMKQRAVELLGNESDGIEPQKGVDLLQICDKSEDKAVGALSRIQAKCSESVN